MEEVILFEKIKSSLKGGLAYSIYPFFSLLVDFFLTPIYTHMIPQSDFGVLVIFNVIKTLGLSLFIFGIGPPFVSIYYGHDVEQKRREVIGTSINLTLLCSLTILIIGILSSDLFSLFLFNSLDYGFYLKITFLGSALLILQRLPTYIFRFKNKIGTFSVINIVFIVIKIVVLVFLVVIAKQGLYGIVIGTLVLEASLTLILVLFITKEISFKFILSDARTMVVLGVPISIQNVEKWIIENLDKLMINFFLSSEEVAIYGIAVGIALVINPILVKSFNFMWGNDAFAYSKDKNVNEFYSRMFVYYVLIGAFLSLGIALTSIDLVKLLFPVHYWPAVHIIGVLVVSEVFIGLSNFFSTLIMVQRKMDYILYVNTLIGILNFILNLLFIPIWNIYGVAFARIVTNFILQLILFFISQNLFSIHYNWVRVIKITFVFAFLYLIGITVLIPSHLLSFLIRGLIASSLPLLLILTRFYDEDEKRILKRGLLKILPYSS